jgi:hypothetical protein
MVKHWLIAGMVVLCAACLSAQEPGLRGKSAQVGSSITVAVDGLSCTTPAGTGKPDRYDGDCQFRRGRREDQCQSHQLECFETRRQLQPGAVRRCRFREILEDCNAGAAGQR